MDIKYNDKYNWLDCLLLYFLDDGYYDDRKDIDTIVRFVKEYNAEQIQKTLDQGKEVLGLDPFPAQWVQDTCNKYPFDQGHETELKDYYPWMQWIVKTLEEEAKKAGKL